FVMVFDYASARANRLKGRYRLQTQVKDAYGLVLCLETGADRWQETGDLTLALLLPSFPRHAYECAPKAPYAVLANLLFQAWLVALKRCHPMHAGAEVYAHASLWELSHSYICFPSGFIAENALQ